MSVASDNVVNFLKDVRVHWFAILVKSSSR